MRPSDSKFAPAYTYRVCCDGIVCLKFGFLKWRFAVTIVRGELAQRIEEPLRKGFYNYLAHMKDMVGPDMAVTFGADIDFGRLGEPGTLLPGAHCII